MSLRISLQKMVVALTSSPHQDIPSSSKLFAQIIIDRNVFAQTVSVECVKDNSDSWEFTVNCKIPEVKAFSIALLREWPPSVNRLLGVLDIERDEVVTKVEQGDHGMKRSLVRVDDKSPSLILSATFSIISQSSLCYTILPNEFEAPSQFICCTEQLSLDPEVVLRRFDQIYRSWRAGKLADPLEISILHEGILLDRSHHLSKAKLLKLLGDICSNDHQSRNIDDLNRAVNAYDDAVRHASSFELNYWTNLGACLLRRFHIKHTNLTDLDKSIQVLEDAVPHTADGHPQKPGLLNNLGMSLVSRFNETGSLNDLKRSIQVLEDRIRLTPDGSVVNPSHLANLGGLLMKRFHLEGNISDLERSIQVTEDAIFLNPDHHPHKPLHLESLGNLLMRRFKQLGNPADFKRSIQLLEESVQLTPNGHHSKPVRISHLGVALMDHFEQVGDPRYLNKSIQLLEEAVLLSQDEHPNKYFCLAKLGTSLMQRFTQIGDLADLKKSIQLLEDAILHLPDGHPDKAGLLNDLGVSNRHLFQRTGDLTALNRSVQVSEASVKLTSEGHSQKPFRLSNLGNALGDRFMQLSSLGDLNRSIQVLEDALELIPAGHSSKPSLLGNLGNLLRSRIERTKNVADLNKAIQVLEDALLLIPNGHPHTVFILQNLGLSFFSRYELTYDEPDLKRSIQALENVLTLTPDGHPRKPQCLNNLTYPLVRHFQKSGNVADLNKAMKLLEEAVLLTPQGHPSKPGYLRGLGNVFETSFDNSSNIEDLKTAISHYSSSAKSRTGQTHIRFLAAKDWGRSAQSMEGWSIALDLIPQLAWLGSTVDDRHSQVIDAGVVTRDAAAAAIAAEKYDTAVEWLEQGRSVVWSQLLQLRSPVDELHQINPELADTLRILSAQLEGRTSGIDQSSSEDINYHSLALERETLLNEIRLLPGFERFLLSKKLTQLLPAANAGPIVLINVAELRCDALVLSPGCNDARHIQLDLTVKDSGAWRNGLESLISNGSLTIHESGMISSRKGIRVPDNGRVLDREEGLRYILAKLWHYVAKPVLEFLGFTSPLGSSEIRRIWWCPTGSLAFLPLHAAGIYPDGPKLSHFVVSSYTPTLSTLLNTAPTQTTKQKQLLTVALPKESRLPGTAQEVEQAGKLADEFRVLHLLESEATPQRVSEAMKGSNWVHFACHGMQDSDNPTQSCLWLAQHSKLTISDIINLSLKNSELAFLSACETATGDKTLEEESVHLAACMLLAGYRGVIATMWMIEDDVAVQIADETYRRLFQKYKADPAYAAEALYFAIMKVRENQEAKGKSSLFAWVPFIHMGI